MTMSKPGGSTNGKRVLISGGGIAGLTLAIQLKQHGFEPLVIERDPAFRTEGYMMDFFGTGWDVAERMGLIERLLAIKYPIAALGFVSGDGEPYFQVPLDRLRGALGGHYTYVRRPDLERVLAERARELGIEIRFSTSLHKIHSMRDRVHVSFDNGRADDFDLVVGADGAHSRVRQLVFGNEREFTRFLGLYVAALHHGIGSARLNGMCKLFEETDRSAFFYPLDDKRMDATYVFRHPQRDIATGQSLAFVRSQYQSGGWITGDVLRDYPESQPVYFDPATIIMMPRWHRGRVALIGDACGCLTLLSGQGSHMAMAGAYVLAEQLAHNDNHREAFAGYQAAIKPHVDRKQKESARFASIFVPSQRSMPWLRRLALKTMFSRVGLPLAMRWFGTRSVLPAIH
jgi:2-polyprenyl-6-methoxyphenol hydroxylase-like FAD-dependent oxidoreductase